jgi:hypothetical protein
MCTEDENRIKKKIMDIITHILDMDVHNDSDGHTVDLSQTQHITNTCDTYKQCGLYICGTFHGLQDTAKQDAVSSTRL